METITSKIPILSEGNHEVTISSISSGINARTRNEYYKLVFSNDNGYLPDWLYLTERSKPFFKSLFKACGITDGSFDFFSLLNKKLRIHVIKSDLINPTTGEFIRENYKINRFDKIVCKKSYYDYEPDDKYSLADIFGSSIEDIAYEMGVDSSDVSEGDVWEAMGY